jgi:hypothetical protein
MNDLTETLSGFLCLQVLRVDSDVVYNAVVDSAGVERLVLAASPQEAMECAFRGGPGSNVKEVRGSRESRETSVRCTPSPHPLVRQGATVDAESHEPSEALTRAAGNLFVVPALGSASASFG